jgi:hypothetical protein
MNLPRPSNFLASLVFIITALAAVSWYQWGPWAGGPLMAVVVILILWRILQPLRQKQREVQAALQFLETEMKAEKPDHALIALAFSKVTGRPAEEVAAAMAADRKKLRERLIAGTKPAE